MINLYKPKRYFLFFIFFLISGLAGFSVIFAAHSYERQRMIYLKSCMDNIKNKADIYRFIRIRISEVGNYLHLYIESEKFSEMDKYESRMFEDISSIDNELGVLDNGGMLVEKLPVSSSQFDKYTFDYSYTRTDKKSYDMRIIDMRAKLEELRLIVQSYRSHLINRMSAEKTSDFELVLSSDQEMRVRTKEIDNFFTSFQMISNDAYISALSDIKLMNDYIASESRRFAVMNLWVCALFGTGLFIYGLWMAYVIWNVLKEAYNARKDYDDLFMNFDTKLKSRTTELFSRLDDIIVSESNFKEKYEYISKILDSMECSFYVIDAKSYEIVYANRYASNGGNILNMTCHAVTHQLLLPCSGKEHPCPLLMVRETREPVTVEHIHTQPDGTDKYFEIRAYPVFNEIGEVVQMIEISVDISDWKKTEQFLISQQSSLEEKIADYSRIANEQSRMRQSAENLLEDNEKRFRQLIENITDIIIVLDENGRIKYASPSMDSVIGFSSEHIRGKFLEDIIPDTDRETFSAWIRDVANGGSGQKSGEFRLVKRGGETITAEAVAVNMCENPSIGGIVLNIRDITARKNAEQEMNKLALVMEQSPVSILITDTDGVIEYANPMFEKVTGYDIAEAIGKKPSILKWDDSNPQLFTDLWQTITSGRIWRGTFTNKKKNGEKYIESAVIAPICGNSGKIINYVAIKEDITELLQARKRAEEASIAKSRFIANISHEIRTPLNSIIGFSDVLKITGLNEKQKGYLATVRSNAETLLDIFNGIMDLADVNSEEFSIDSQVVNVDALADTVNRVHRKSAENKNIAFLSYVDADIPKKLKGDSFRIGQAASNLLSNAVKFTEPGGQIEFNIFKKSETDTTVSVEFEVKDTGIGISQEKLSIIFDSFVQGDSTVTRRFGGAGLGLSIAKNILKKFGSDIKVETEEGGGSTFSFVIEFEKPDTEERGTAPSEMHFSFDELSAQIGLAPNVVVSLLTGFCEESSADLKKAAEELSGGNIRNARDLIHSVRSAAGNLRIDVLTEKLKNADEFAKKNNTLYVKELIKEIIDMLTLIKNETLKRGQHGL